MTTTAQYASVVKSGNAQGSTANTNRDGTGTLQTICTAGATATRLDGLAIKATGNTTAGMLRFYLTKGRPGLAITSITFVGTTAIVTTVGNHGLTTGNTVTTQNVMPDDYNMVEAAITVTGATTFTYVMSTTPTTNATSVGIYTTFLATPVNRLFRELAITSAITPSGTVTSYEAFMATGNVADKGYFPLTIPAGWAFRFSTNNAETFNIIPTLAGDF